MLRAGRRSCCRWAPQRRSSGSGRSTTCNYRTHRRNTTRRRCSDVATAKLNIGDKAPDFSLPGVDGKTYSLADFSDKKVLIVAFWCNHCPYVKAYEQRTIELQADYADKSVAVVAICSNDAVNYPEDSFERMAQVSKKHGYNFPYLHDETQEVARAYGAGFTPEYFVFDSERKLAYHGRMDDNVDDPRRVTRRYIREAVDAVLAGESVKNTGVFPVGCSIKWK